MGNAPQHQRRPLVHVSGKTDNHGGRCKATAPGVTGALPEGRAEVLSQPARSANRVSRGSSRAARGRTRSPGSDPDTPSTTRSPEAITSPARTFPPARPRTPPSAPLATPHRPARLPSTLRLASAAASRTTGGDSVRTVHDGTGAGVESDAGEEHPARAGPFAARAGRRPVRDETRREHALGIEGGRDPLARAMALQDPRGLHPEGVEPISRPAGCTG